MIFGIGIAYLLEGIWVLYFAISEAVEHTCKVLMSFDTGTDYG